VQWCFEWVRSNQNFHGWLRNSETFNSRIQLFQLLVNSIKIKSEVFCSPVNKKSKKLNEESSIHEGWTWLVRCHHSSRRVFRQFSWGKVCLLLCWSRPCSGYHSVLHSVKKYFIIIYQVSDEKVSIVVWSLNFTSEGLVQFFLFKKHMVTTFAEQWPRFTGYQ
jgi:hypothetical protein